MPDSFILDMLNIKNTEKEFFYVEKKLNYNELIKTTISEIEDKINSITVSNYIFGMTNKEFIEFIRT